MICTYRRVQIDEDGARDIFAISSLSEEGLEGPLLANVACVRVNTAICFEAVLEEIPVKTHNPSGVRHGTHQVY